MSGVKILVVDDDVSVRESLRLILERQYDVRVAEDAEEALKIIFSPLGEFFPGLVVLDLMMPGVDGLACLEKIRGKFPEMPVIMMTASSAVQSAVKAMKLGAVDYLSKPYDVDELLSLIEETLSSGSVGRVAPAEVRIKDISRSNLPPIEGDFGCLVGRSGPMQELYARIDQIARHNTTVLITGDSGTGKELVARELHNRSPRHGKPFVALNCAAIPESLIESELFGHEKGAFTHALERRIGHFEQADGGTLFLDEIGELSLPVQVKMLRFLQEQEFHRVGRSKTISVDVRVIAATNRNLEECIRRGTFREDLYYRINVIALEMPTLAERRDDVPLLVEKFMHRLSPVYGGRKVTVAPEVMVLLSKYQWPGNVRELENVTESLLALTSADEIAVSDLPMRLRQGEVAASSPTETILAGNMNFEEAEKAFETEIILGALEKAGYVQTKAADILGISRRILKYKMDKLGIVDRPADE
ncbi:MAG: sigma-54 dependent transcriptional regulator [bacterium]|nr:sigma-54 dependent transcriptional regulator [bacterium]